MASSATLPQISWLYLTHFGFLDMLGTDDHTFLKFHFSLTSIAIIFSWISKYLCICIFLLMSFSLHSGKWRDKTVLSLFFFLLFHSLLRNLEMKCLLEWLLVLPVCISFGLQGAELQPAFYGISRVNKGPGAF